MNQTTISRRKILLGGVMLGAGASAWANTGSWPERQSLISSTGKTPQLTMGAPDA